MVEVTILQNLYSKFISSWQQASRRKRLCFYIGAYTLVFLIAFLITYSPYLWDDLSFCFKFDGRKQHYPIVIYIGRALRHIFRGLLEGTLSIPLFDISMGSGDDVIGFLNSLGGTDPLLLMSGLVPVKYSEHLYAFLTIFRLYLAGLSFSYLCFYFKKRAIHTLIGSIVYCFSGYGLLCSVRHPYFVNPMLLLPLLIVGIDKVLKKERPYLFILAMFYTALCGYYHLYMMTLMVFLYAVVRFFDLYEEKRSKEFLLALGRGIVSYLLGLGLGAIVFLSSIAEFMNAGRNGLHNYDACYWIYSYVRLARLIVPPGDWDNMAFAAIVVLALVLLFLSKKRQRRTLQILTVAAFVVLLTKYGALLMNGFQYPSHRWSFGLVLIASFTLVELLPELLSLSRNQKIICLTVLAVHTVICFATKFGRTLKYFPVGVIFLALTLLVLTMSLQETAKKDGEEEKNNSKSFALPYREMFCVLLVVFNVGVNGIYLFAADQLGYARAESQKRGYEVTRMQNDIVRELEPFLRKNPSGRGDGSSFTVNTAMVWQVPDMLIYSSAGNKNILEFWDRMENCWREEYFRTASSDQRTIVNALLSGRYQVETGKTAGYVPFGYSKIKSTKKGNEVYENDYALPWGYTYDKVISYELLDSMHGLAKQEAMLQGIALNEKLMPVTGKEGLRFDERRLPYTVKYTNCEWKDGLLSVQQPNATMTLNFTMPKGVEGYVRLHSFESSDPRLESFFVGVKCKDVVKRSIVLSRLYRYYHGVENYLFNLGYKDEERNSLTLTFPHKGNFKLQDVELYALPMTNYPARVNALRAEPLENIQWGNNSLSGSVDLSKDKILCVSVPYSKGWSATVDGQEAEILRGNYMFMALPLKAGHHDIVFSYCSPGLKLGAAISFLCGCILIGMRVRERLNKRIEVAR